jgi:hypothetical protein
MKFFKGFMKETENGYVTYLESRDYEWFGENRVESYSKAMSFLKEKCKDTPYSISFESDSTMCDFLVVLKKNQ